MLSNVSVLKLCDCQAIISSKNFRSRLADETFFPAKSRSSCYSSAVSVNGAIENPSSIQFSWQIQRVSMTGDKEGQKDNRKNTQPHDSKFQLRCATKELPYITPGMPPSSEAMASSI